MSISSSFKRMETKQKVILLVTILAFIYVIYLGYDTFFAHNSGADVTVPATTEPSTQVEAGPIQEIEPDTATDVESSTKVVAKAAPVTEAQKSNEGGSEQQIKAAGNKIIEVSALEPTPEQMALLAEAQEMQREYLRLVNQYQIAQLQERLETANASIAAAKLKSAITASEVQKLNDELKQRSLRGQSSSVSLEGKKEAVDFVATLQLMYVGKSKGAWMAMLNSNGSYYEVKVGTRLPDGSTVSAIDTRGIVLTKDSMKRYVPMPKALD